MSRLIGNRFTINESNEKFDISQHKTCSNEPMVREGQQDKANSLYNWHQVYNS